MGWQACSWSTPTTAAATACGCSAAAPDEASPWGTHQAPPFRIPNKSLPPPAIGTLTSMPAKTILIQNYHPSATCALIRDFRRIGFTVYSPDSNWDRIGYYGDNTGLGGMLISQEDYFKLEPGFVLITCSWHEQDLGMIAKEHGDDLVLNIAQHGQFYEPGISHIMVCPDIITFDISPPDIRHKLLYFMRPHLSATPEKDLQICFLEKKICSYISTPHVWVKGHAAYMEFKDKYSHECRSHGFEAPDGHLSHADCNRLMSDSFLTAHFKDDEAYGLSCIESMMLGTPILGLRNLMNDKTLGRFFLDESNSILVNTVDEALERLYQLSMSDYVEMSQNARKRALELTSDDNTIVRLKQAFDSEYGPAFAQK
jgi:hypothetical protein